MYINCSNCTIIETERLFMREFNNNDYEDLCKMLMDINVMYAYEHSFSPEEAKNWLENQKERYKKYGFGLWAVILKKTGSLIGQCGITLQEIGAKKVLEVGYIFNKTFWRRGYAIESARACRNYAFDFLGALEVFSIIRDNNFPSMNVAIRNNMLVRGSVIKHYHNMDMPHLIFSIKKSEYGRLKK